MIPIAIALSQIIPTHEATTPTARVGEAWWAARHAEKVELSKSRTRLCFLGDSITQRWETVGPASWNTWQAANFGFNGDRTQHALWRILNKELVPARPDVVVLLIGTNNLGHGADSPTKAADGIRLLVQTLQKGRSGVRVLLLTLIPRGKLDSDAIRRQSDALSLSIKKMANGTSIYAYDIAPIFLNADRSLRADRLMPDLVHPNESGYKALGNSIRSKVAQLLAF